MPPTLLDIAEKCGVSTATVSLVLSNHSRISPETRKKVLKVVKSLNYHPNLSARMLTTNLTQSLCVVVPQLSHIFSNPYFGEILSGIYDCASENDYKIMLEVATQEFCSEKRYLKLFRERRIDGMFYIGSTLKDIYLKDFEKEQFSFIQVGSYFRNLKLNYVTGDNMQGGYVAAKHLIAHGHKRIGFITGHFNVISARDRFKGYKKALKEANINLDEDLVVPADFDELTGYTAMLKLLSLPRTKRPRAVFAGNDLMAMGAVRAIKESGLSVPDDVAIVGMDNLRLSSIGETKLTTVEYNVYLMGKISCSKLIELIKNKRANERFNVQGVVKEVIPVTLVIRDTCGKKH